MSDIRNSQVFKLIDIEKEKNKTFSFWSLYKNNEDKVLESITKLKTSNMI